MNQEELRDFDEAFANLSTSNLDEAFANFAMKLDANQTETAAQTAQQSRQRMNTNAIEFTPARSPCPRALVVQQAQQAVHQQQIHSQPSLQAVHQQAYEQHNGHPQSQHQVEYAAQAQARNPVWMTQHQQALQQQEQSDVQDDEQADDIKESKEQESKEQESNDIAHAWAQVEWTNTRWNHEEERILKEQLATQLKEIHLRTIQRDKMNCATDLSIAELKRVNELSSSGVEDMMQSRFDDFNALLGKLRSLRRERDALVQALVDLRRAQLRYAEAVSLPAAPYSAELSWKMLPVRKVTEKDVKGKKVCLICMTDFIPEDETRQLPCFHEFHQKCIDRWFEEQRGKGIDASCPVDRIKVRDLLKQQV